MPLWLIGLLVLLIGAVAGLALRGRGAQPAPPPAPEPVGAVSPAPPPARPAPSAAPEPRPSEPTPSVEEIPPPPEATPPAPVEPPPPPEPVAPPDPHGRYAYAGLPRYAAPRDEYQVLENRGYAVGYSEVRKDPLWAAYTLREGPRQDLGRRPQHFYTDERTQARVEHRDYTQRDYNQNRDAYDRGHMAPNYAIAAFYGREAQLETFKLTNVCPQRKGLNQQTWEALEKTITTDWLRDFQQVWVTVGPIFGPRPERLNGVVEIPDAFYALILREDQGQPRVLALQLAQTVHGASKLRPFVTSVRAIEQATRLDFYAELPDDVEAELEQSSPDDRWDLDTVRVPSQH